MKALSVNGKLCSSFSISPFDVSWKWGMGFFTTLKVEGGKIWFFKAHLQKLKQACHFASIPFSKKTQLYLLWARRLISSIGAEKGVWRLKIILLWEGRVVMTIEKEQQAIEKEIDVWLCSQPFCSCLAAYKTLSYMDRYLLLQTAQTHNCQEVLTLDAQSYLLEGACSNLFWIDKQHIYTPSPKLSLYEGTTLTACMQWAKDQGYSVHQGSYPLNKLLKSEGAFVCNSMKGVRAIKTLFIGNRKKSWPSSKVWVHRLNKALKNQHQSHL